MSEPATPGVIIVAEPHRVEDDLAAGVLACAR